MNNLLSYCGLFDARISASEKDLPVQCAGLDSVAQKIESRTHCCHQSAQTAQSML